MLEVYVAEHAKYHNVADVAFESESACKLWIEKFKFEGYRPRRLSFWTMETVRNVEPTAI